MTALAIKKFNIDEYHRLIEMGLLSQNDRVELIYGQLVIMAVRRPKHAAILRNLNLEMISLVGINQKAIVGQESPIILANHSEPEPDLILAQYRSDKYLAQHPIASDIILLIEVSDSTLLYDQTTKLQLYARSGIQYYWIVNLVDDCLEMYSQPLIDNSKNPNYKVKVMAMNAEQVAIPLFDDLFLDLARVFI